MKKLRTACYEEVILSSNILTAKVYDDKAQWLAKEEAELVKSIYKNFESLVKKIKSHLTSKQKDFIDVELIKSIDNISIEDGRAVRLSITMKLFDNNMKPEFLSIKESIINNMETAVVTVENINKSIGFDPSEILITNKAEENYSNLDGKVICLPNLAADLTNIFRKIDTPAKKMALTVNKKFIEFETNKSKKVALLENSNNSIEVHTSNIFYVDDTKLKVNILVDKKYVNVSFDMTFREKLILSQLDRSVVKFTIEIIRLNDRGNLKETRYIIINIEEADQLKIF